MKRFFKHGRVRVRLAMWAFLLLLFFYTMALRGLEKWVGRSFNVEHHTRPLNQH